MDTEKFYLVIDGVIVDAGSEADLVNTAAASGYEDYVIVNNIEGCRSVFVGDERVIDLESEIGERLVRIFT